jgi:hypothetical protein
MVDDRMTVRAIPARHWRSYGDDKLPTGAEAMGEPFAAFPSWFIRIECDCCGKVQMLNETYMRRRDMLIRDIIARMRHDGCGGRAGKRADCPKFTAIIFLDMRKLLWHNLTVNFSKGYIKLLRNTQPTLTFPLRSTRTAQFSRSQCRSSVTPTAPENWG